MAFTDKRDKLVFALLTRTLKETGCRNLILQQYRSTEKIIEQCLLSRKTHPREPYFGNMTFWATDLSMNVTGNKYMYFECLFLARVVNNVVIIDVEEKDSMIKDILYGCIENIISFVGHAGMHSYTIEFLENYGEEIGEALLLCDDFFEYVPKYNVRKNKFFNLIKKLKLKPSVLPV